jgi:hypothetical protein
MARNALRDPLDKFRWKVSIDGFSRLGFSACSTPSYNLNITEYAEGGAHLTPRKIVDSVTHTPVTLARGVTNDTSFNKWANGFIDLVTNNAAVNEAPEIFGIALPTTGALGVAASAASALGFTGPVPVASNSAYPFQYRRTVTIEHINRLGVAEVVYILYGAFPIQYKPASDFDAATDDGVSVETLVLTYESFDVRYAGAAALAQNLLAK